MREMHLKLFRSQSDTQVFIILINKTGNNRSSSQTGTWNIISARQLFILAIYVLYRFSFMGMERSNNFNVFLREIFGKKLMKSGGLFQYDPILFCVFFSRKEDRERESLLKMSIFSKTNKRTI